MISSDDEGTDPTRNGDEGTPHKGKSKDCQPSTSKESQDFLSKGWRVISASESKKTININLFLDEEKEKHKPIVPPIVSTESDTETSYTIAPLVAGKSSGYGCASFSYREESSEVTADMLKLDLHKCKSFESLCQNSDGTGTVLNMIFPERGPRTHAPDTNAQEYPDTHQDTTNPKIKAKVTVQKGSKKPHTKDGRSKDGRASASAAHKDGRASASAAHKDGRASASAAHKAANEPKIVKCKKQWEKPAVDLFSELNSSSENDFDLENMGPIKITVIPSHKSLASVQASKSVATSSSLRSTIAAALAKNDRKKMPSYVSGKASVVKTNHSSEPMDASPAPVKLTSKSLKSNRARVPYKRTISASRNASHATIRMPNFKKLTKNERKAAKGNITPEESEVLEDISQELVPQSLAEIKIQSSDCINHRHVNNSYPPDNYQIEDINLRIEEDTEPFRMAMSTAAVKKWIEGIPVTNNGFPMASYSDSLLTEDSDYEQEKEECESTEYEPVKETSKSEESLSLWGLLCKKVCQLFGLNSSSRKSEESENNRQSEHAVMQSSCRKKDIEDDQSVEKSTCCENIQDQRTGENDIQSTQHDMQSTQHDMQSTQHDVQSTQNEVYSKMHRVSLKELKRQQQRKTFVVSSISVTNVESTNRSPKLAWPQEALFDALREMQSKSWESKAHAADVIHRIATQYPEISFQHQMGIVKAFNNGGVKDPRCAVRQMALITLTALFFKLKFNSVQALQEMCHILFYCIRHPSSNYVIKKHCNKTLVCLIQGVPARLLIDIFINYAYRFNSEIVHYMISHYLMTLVEHRGSHSLFRNPSRETGLLIKAATFYAQSNVKRIRGNGTRILLRLKLNPVFGEILNNYLSEETALKVLTVIQKLDLSLAKHRH